MGAGYIRKVRVLVATEKIIDVYAISDWLNEAQNENGVIKVLGFADEEIENENPDHHHSKLRSHQRDCLQRV